MYKKILFCTDGSANSACAQREALKMAKECGAEFIAVCVVDITDEFEAIAPGTTEKLERHAREVADGVVATATSQGLKATAAVREGDPSQKILEVAKEMGADAIVLGTHGRRGFMNAVMGSVAKRVIAEAFVPVVIIHSKFCAL